MTRQATLAVSLSLLIFGATSSANAQDVPQVITPLRIEADQNGVNIVTGKITPAIPVLSIPAAPNLRFDWVGNAAPYVIGRIPAGDPDTTPKRFSVHFGGASSEAFDCYNLACESVTGTGSMLNSSGRRFRRAGSGEVYALNLKHYDFLNAEGRSTFY